MVDLIAINRKYEKIFKLLDIILIFAVFIPILLHNIILTLAIITGGFYLPDFYWNLISDIYPVFIAIYGFILIFSIHFSKKGKTKQIKDFALTTFGKCLIFGGINTAIVFVIMLIFNYFNWYSIFLLFSLIFFIFLEYNIYVFDGMFNLKLRKAKKLKSNEKNDDALILFNELENENYEYPSLYYGLGLIYIDKEEYDKALEYFNKLNNLETNLKFQYDKDLCNHAYEHKAYSLHELKRYDEALEAIDKALVLKDNNDWSWNEKGYILYLLEEYGKSLQFFDKAIEINSTNQYAYYSMLSS